MCAMCVVIGSFALVGGVIAYASGKLAGKFRADNEKE